MCVVKPQVRVASRPVSVRGLSTLSCGLAWGLFELSDSRGLNLRSSILYEALFLWTQESSEPPARELVLCKPVSSPFPRVEKAKARGLACRCSFGGFNLPARRVQLVASAVSAVQQSVSPVIPASAVRGTSY